MSQLPASKKPGRTIGLLALVLGFFALAVPLLPGKLAFLILGLVILVVGLLKNYAGFSLGDSTAAGTWFSSGGSQLTDGLFRIRLASPEQSTQRVAMRVSQGGHDVPDDKLLSRFPRTLDNLQAAIHRLPHVLIYDNSDLGAPFRQIAYYDHGQLRHLQETVPEWLRPLIHQ